MQTTWHKLFPSSCLYQYCTAPPHSGFLALSIAISLTYTGSSPLPLCKKCNSNLSQSTMVGICPSLHYDDGLDETGGGGGGHTDWECLWAHVCVCVQSVSQSVTLMPLVACCGCGGDKRLTVRFYHLVYVAALKLRCNKNGFMKDHT